jgi:glutamine synthetase
VATAGNEHRLGANEAPPAIVSVFLGEQLFKIMENLKNGKMEKVSQKGMADLGLSHLPNFLLDNTDRNRTSPFAFTGAKFEFRAVGSSMNISTSIAVLNTIIADSIMVVVDKIKKAIKGADLGKAVFTALSEIVKECHDILFEGDNYSDAWKKEAARRGLPNIASSPEALKAFVGEGNVALFEKHKVFSASELKARYHIWIEMYNKILDIEAKTLVDIVKTQVLPAAYEYQTALTDSYEALAAVAGDNSIGIDSGVLDDRKEALASLSNNIYYVRKNTKELGETLNKAAALDEENRAHLFFTELKSQLSHIRKHVDELEALMPDESWTLPKYREMLFIS